MSLPRHRVVTQADNSTRLHGLLVEVCPQVLACTAIAARARDLATEARDTVPETLPWPATVKEFSDKWIEHEVARRRDLAGLEHRLTVFADMEFNSLTEAGELVESHSVALVLALARQFDDLVDRLTGEIAKLGDARTAAEAIAAGSGAVEAWSVIADCAAEYEEIRAVQRLLYRGCDTLTYDELRCGDGNPKILDPEARLYFHRHLNAIAPNWRGRSNSEGEDLPAQYPWPHDPVERLVWLIVNTSGMWLPTPAEIAAELRGASATADRPRRRGRGVSWESGLRRDLRDAPTATPSTTLPVESSAVATASFPKMKPQMESAT